MPDLYDLAVIGRGSTAAYYLSTVDPTRYPNVVVIGGEDPWVEQRGYNADKDMDPVNFINHTLQMIGHYGKTVPEWSKDLVDRKDWAKQNDAIITSFGGDQCKTRIVGQRVKSIAEAALPKEFQYIDGEELIAYRVEDDGGTVYWAMKVVVATGAGPHSVPPEVNDVVKSAPDRILNMDQFAQKVGKLAGGQTVFVIGPNAPIDTVETARFNKFNVHWLIRDGKTKKPVFLPTNHQTEALQQNYVNYSGNSLKVTAAGPKIKVEYTDAATKSPVGPLEGDYFVYGIGQDARAATSFIDEDIKKKLVPVFDVNQRFGDASETVLGLQMEGTNTFTGFEVVGSLSLQVTKMISRCEQATKYLDIMKSGLQEVRSKLFISPFILSLVSTNAPTLLLKFDELVTKDPKVVEKEAKMLVAMARSKAASWVNHLKSLSAMSVNYITAYRYLKSKNYLDVDKDNDKDWTDWLDNVTKGLTPSVVQSPQLGAIRSGTAARNAAIPEYVGNGKSQGDVNFSHDDRTILRVYIAVNYPFVTESDAQSFIAEVIGGRKDVDGGYGYSPEKVKMLKMKLASLNEQGKVPLATAKSGGTGSTVLVL